MVARGGRDGRLRQDFEVGGKAEVMSGNRKQSVLTDTRFFDRYVIYLFKQRFTVRTLL